MTTNVQTYQIGKTKTLIDLNGDTTNFEISFRITSKNKEPFDLLVVDQTTLDNSPNLEYKRVDNGTISGTVINDKNVYQNYFLIVKAENPCECAVEIIKKELPKKPVPLPTVVPQIIQAPAPSKRGLSFSKILLVLGVIFGIGYGLYLYSKSRVKEADPPKSSVFRAHVATEDLVTPTANPDPVLPRPELQPRIQPRVNLQSTAVPTQVKNPLLDRLKSLKVN